MRIQGLSLIGTLSVTLMTVPSVGAPIQFTDAFTCVNGAKIGGSVQHIRFAASASRHSKAFENDHRQHCPRLHPIDAVQHEQISEWYSGHPYQAHDDRIQAPRQGSTYPLERMEIIRGFDDDKCWHQGIDIYADLPHFGIGIPVRSITRARVTALAIPEKNPWAYGHPDRRHGVVTRKGTELPRRLQISGYGDVFPFSRRVGRAKTGTMVVTQSLHPDYRGHRIRYMHLAAIRPDLKVGDIIEVGEELGLLGGTGIRESIPHLHMDIENRRGIRQDVARLIGLASVVPSGCRGINKAYIARKRRHRHVVRRGDSLWKIARKHKTTEKRLMTLNRIRNPRALRIGQRLRIR